MSDRQRQLSFHTAKARRGDPIESHAAAGRFDITKLSENRRAVLAAFRYFGSLTDEELVARYPSLAVKFQLAKQSPSGLRTRRKELTDLGYLLDTGEKRKTTAGNKARVFARPPDPEGKPS